MALLRIEYCNSIVQTPGETCEEFSEQSVDAFPHRSPKRRKLADAKPGAPVLQLPADILLLIFQRLDHQSLAESAQVCEI